MSELKLLKGISEDVTLALWDSQITSHYTVSDQNTANINMPPSDNFEDWPP